MRLALNKRQADSASCLVNILNRRALQSGTVATASPGDIASLEKPAGFANLSGSSLTIFHCILKGGGCMDDRLQTTRRTFLKVGGAALAGTAAVSCGISPFKKDVSLSKLKKEDNPKEAETWKHTACAMCLMCPLQVKVKKRQDRRCQR